MLILSIILPSNGIFSHIFIKWHFGHIASFVFFPNLKQVKIFLTWWLYSRLNDVYSAINMFSKPWLLVYIFALVATLVGIWKCQLKNTVIRTWSTFILVFHPWCHVIWNQTSLSKPFDALLLHFIFQLCFFSWWKADGCWPKIIFFITPINHADVKTGT